MDVRAAAGTQLLRTGRQWIRAHQGLSLFAVVVAVVVLCNGIPLTVRALGPAPRPVALSDTSGLPLAGSAAHRCEQAVAAMLSLTPNAWSYGLRQGVSPGPLVRLFGSSSVEVRTFTRTQQSLLSYFHVHGYVKVNSELARLRPQVRQDCA